jgi:hypothetical protein
MNLDGDVGERGEMPQTPVVVLSFSAVAGTDRHYSRQMAGPEPRG